MEIHQARCMLLTCVTSNSIKVPGEVCSRSEHPGRAGERQTMVAPYCDREKRIVAARVSESPLPNAQQTYPTDKQYYARPDETPQKIAKIFGTNLEVTTKIVSLHYPFCSIFRLFRRNILRYNRY